MLTLWHKFVHSIALDLAIVALTMLAASVIGVWLTAVWSPL